MNPRNVKLLVAHRLEQAQTALDDAKCLIDANRSSTSIVNRSYYAMFYAVLALLQAIGQAPSKHAGAVSLFDREFVAKGLFDKQMSKELHTAFELRQNADYRELAPVERGTAIEIWQAASSFVAAVRDYFHQGRAT